MAKILIVAPSWIGDALLAQPLFSRLHQLYDELFLYVLATPWTIEVFTRMPEVSATIPSAFRHGELALSRRRTLARELAQRRFDLAIVLPNSFKSALIPFFAGIAERRGYIGEMRWPLLTDARRLDKESYPLMAERYALLGEPRGDALKRPLPVTRLAIDEEQRRATLGKLELSVERPIAILCPGAEYGPAKRWPAPYFAQLAQKLTQSGYGVWLLGSAKDREIGNEIAVAARGACIDLCGKTNVGEAIDLMSFAALVVSNDSGLMHVAAALDKPLTAIYGSSSPAFTPPLSARARVVKLALPCSPCFRRECPLGHFNCMRQLTPDQVWRHIPFEEEHPLKLIAGEPGGL